MGTDLIGFVHVIAGYVALAVGLAILLREKGTSSHSAIGLCYVVAMAVLNLTALMIYRISGHFEVFHGLALFTLAVVLVGFSAAVLRRPRRSWLEFHYFFMTFSYVGLLSASGSEFLARIAGWSPTLSASVSSAIVIAVGSPIIALRRNATIKSVR